MQRAARRQENMLKELYSIDSKGAVKGGINSEEMLSEIDITHSMNFYPNYNEEIKMCL